jgi:spore maturation protein CgeB
VALSFLIVDTYYPAFLETFHEAHAELGDADYDEALATLMATCFGTSDFYSKNLRLLGHEAIEVVPNDRVLQSKWAAERGLELNVPSAPLRVASRIPYLRRFLRRPDYWVLSGLARQIEAERPEILYFQDISLCEPTFIESIRPFVKLIVGQIAAPPLPEQYLRGCDLILTSFPHFVERFRALGIDSEYLKLGFESTLLERLTRSQTTYDAVFVGGIADVHVEATASLEKAAREVGLDFWGYGVENLSKESPLRKKFHGQAWGLEMYNLFFNARIVVNRHSSASEQFANNMRLYEATGAGAMLITDEKDNLGELFENGKEVVAYRGADDLVEKIKHYLSHEDERASIARVGQERTLRNHTYGQRMEQLEQILEAYL